jgi:hypothetical protein
MTDPALIDAGVAIGSLIVGAVVWALRAFVRDVFRSPHVPGGAEALVCPRCGGTGRKLGPPQETWMECPRCGGSGLR